MNVAPLPAASRPARPLVRTLPLVLCRVLTRLPVLGLGMVAILMVRVKLALGFWPFCPLHDAPNAGPWPGSAFPDLLEWTIVAAFLGALATLSLVVAIPLRWRMGAWRPSRGDLLCLLCGLVLLYTLFGPTRGWGEWFYD